MEKSKARGESARAALRKAIQAAREEPAASGRYRIGSVKGVHVRPVEHHAPRHCAGCEAAIARRLGTQQSMPGIIRRVRQTDYYVIVMIQNANIVKIINSQIADFEGEVEAWANRAKVLISYQVLPR